MKIVAIIILIVFGGYISAFANDQVVQYPNLAKFEKQLLSQDMTCDQKQDLVNTVDDKVLRELFNRLGEKNVILRKARERNELMNIVFAYDGRHEWSRDDMRVLHLMFVEWREMMVPECFDPRASGFSSKEWLQGAAFVVTHKEQVLGCE